MKILYAFLFFDLFLLEGKQGLSVGEFDIMQICLVFSSSLVLISLSFLMFSVFIWLWSYYFHFFIFMVYDVG